MRNIRKRGKGYAAAYYVPKHLQEIIGKKEILRGLGTRDYREAQRRAPKVLAVIAAEVHKDDPTDLNTQAIEIAKVHRENSDQGEYGNPVEWGVSDMADAIAEEQGVEVAARFYRVATNKALPMSVALEQWHEASTGIASDTRYQYKRDVEAFIAWSKDMTVQEVDDEVAANYWRFLTAAPTKHKRPIAPATLNRKVGSLNRLWKWMRLRRVYRGHNPWTELLEEAPGEAKRGRNTKELRALTKAEAQKYLEAVRASKSKYASAGADVIVLMWHTGIRPEDLTQLTVDRVNDDSDEGVTWLTVVKGKTESNTRVLPVVSPEARAILNRRAENAKDGILFHDVPPGKVGSTEKGRYWRLQKVINPIRRKVLKGVPVDTYSCRRAFSGACEDAGLDPVQWSRMMGHSAPTLASAVYNRGHEGRVRLLNGIRKVDAELGELASR